MPTPSIQTLRTDAQQVLNLDSISAVRSVVAATLANANAGTPLNPNLTTQQLWNEFYQIVTQPKSDIESIIANQLMKFMYAPPAPGGLAGSGRVIFNKNGQLTTDPSFTWDDVLNNLAIGGNARTGSGTVGSPSHSFGSDTNTGAYNPGPDIWAVATNGVERFRIDASGNITASGTFTALGGENASAIRAAASDYAAVNFDGATSATRIASACQAIGTGDFSLWSRFRVPTANPSGNAGIFFLSDIDSSANRTNAFFGYFTSGGVLQVQRYGATTSDLRIAAISGFRSTYSGQVVDIVVTRTGATLKIYINGTDTAYTESTGGTAPAWSDTIVSSFFAVGCISGAANTIFSGRIYRSVVFNRALSAGDVTELITTGVNPADQWGTQTQAVGYNPAVLNGGFETNSLNASGTWATAVSGTSTATIDTSGSFSRTGTNAGKLTLDGSASYTSFLASNGSTTLLALAKRYRISIWARKGAASGACGIQFGPSAAGSIYGNSGLTLATTYSNTLVEVVTSVDGGLTIGRYSGSAALSEIYVDDVEVTRIGAIVDLDFTVGTGYQATDRSTNALHGTLFNGVEFTQPKQVAVLYATTNTNGNQQMLGTLAIPTNAIIEDIIVNSTGSATVSIGNVSAGTQIVNGASVVSGRQKLTLATPFSTTGNLWVNSNSTATLQFTILYTVAA
jgi:hypothetical protein